MRGPGSRPVRETTERKRAPRLTGAQRRVQLLSVAREVFAERGFAATSVEEIAERAGVSKPVVYEHFGGKDGVYAVVVKREVAELVARIKRALRPGDPRGTIVEAVDTFLHYIEDQPQGFTIILRDAPDGLPSVLDEISRAVAKLLSSELSERGYDKRMAPVLARSLVGMVAVPGQWWVKARRPRRQQMADQIVNLAWNGLSRLDGAGHTRP